MIVKKNDNELQRDPFPAGMHQAVCYSIVDLGHQKTEWQGQISYKRQVFITWEVPSLRIEYEKDGQKMEGPKVIGKKYTASLGDKAILRKDLESWRGKAFTDAELEGFDISKLLGANCLLNVVHNTKDGRTYSNVGAITPLMPNMEKLNPENPVINYEITQREVFPENLPQWMRDIILNAREFGQEPEKPDNSEHTNVEEEDDLPF